MISAGTDGVSKLLWRRSSSSGKGFLKEGRSDLGLSDLGLSDLGLSDLGLSDLGLSDLDLSVLDLGEESLRDEELPVFLRPRDLSPENEKGATVICNPSF
ncbi:MAG: hypothetical protein FGM63_05945 [Candidatus Nanopelagicaceae bacterium]|nr:hypothetical protein [Candidatus Nanopelagicaceae bacterium]